jgi:DNA-binding LytR/AlgR family response regulator
MTKINVLVVEDESIVSKDIQLTLKKLGYEVVGSATTGENAVELALSLEPDVILMDIMLKGAMSGVEAAESIQKEISVPIIFLTAYADDVTLNKAKKTHPYGYIIKPFKQMDLHTTIEIAIYKHKKNVEVIKERDFLYSLVENKDQTDLSFIFVKANSKFVKIKNSDIYFIEALKDYVVINTLNKRYTIHSTMKDIEIKLGNKDFFRVHRSFIVRVDKIGSIDFPNLILEDEKKIIPVGGSYKEELIKRVGII